MAEVVTSEIGQDPVPREELARRLRQAYQSGPVPPLRDGLSPTDANGAYAVQLLNQQVWEGAGRRIVGRKVGLTSKVVQKQLGVDQPDFGTLFDDMQVPNGGVLAAGSLIQPRVEAEVAFVLGHDLGGAEISEADVLAATRYAVAAIEIVDSRIADWKITFADTVADNGSSAFFVLGQEKKPLAGLDLYSCGMVMEVNGAVVSYGAGAACLGHPLSAVAWLARRLSSSGERLRAGDIVLSGALGPMVSLSPGDEVKAQLGGIGAVSFRYGQSGL